MLGTPPPLCLSPPNPSAPPKPLHPGPAQLPEDSSDSRSAADDVEIVRAWAPRNCPFPFGECDLVLDRRWNPPPPPPPPPPPAALCRSRCRKPPLAPPASTPLLESAGERVLPLLYPEPSPPRMDDGDGGLENPPKALDPRPMWATDIDRPRRRRVLLLGRLLPPLNSRSVSENPGDPSFPVSKVATPVVASPLGVSAPLARPPFLSCPLDSPVAKTDRRVPAVKLADRRNERLRRCCACW